jgi:hypothetical protein
VPEQVDRDYVRRLGEVLATRNPEHLKSFLEASARRYGDQRQVDDVLSLSPAQIRELMHRMILARGDLARFHAESRNWLQVKQAEPSLRPPRRKQQQS